MLFLITASRCWTAGMPSAPSQGSQWQRPRTRPSCLKWTLDWTDIFEMQARLAVTDAQRARRSLKRRERQRDGPPASQMSATAARASLFSTHALGSGGHHPEVAIRCWRWNAPPSCG
jgi:hypothetical protein